MSECQNPFGADTPTLAHHGYSAFAQVLKREERIWPSTSYPKLSRIADMRIKNGQAGSPTFVRVSVGFTDRRPLHRRQLPRSGYALTRPRRHCTESGAKLSAGYVASEDLPCDEPLLQLIGAFVDLTDLAVAIEGLHRAVGVVGTD